MITFIKENNKKIHFIMFFMCFILMCFIPLLTDLYSYNKNTIVVECEDIQPLSLKTDSVSQDIILQGKANNLEIMFWAPSGQLYNDATVNITITQNGKKIQKDINLRNILLKGSYERPQLDEAIQTIPFTQKYVMCPIDVDLSKLDVGIANINIKANQLPEGTDFFCMASKTITSGLPSAQYGENLVGMPIVLSYSVIKINFNFWYETILLVLLLILIIASSYLICVKEDLVDRYNLLFYFAFFTVFIFVSIQSPMASLLGEPRSESAYEFWYKAKEYGFFKSLMTLMSGESLVWTERILMSIAVFISPSSKYVFSIAQVLELIVISAITAMPCLPAFKKYFSNKIRFIFSIFIGTSLFFIKAYYFWSVSYWVIIFFILLCFIDFDEIKRFTFVILMVISTIFAISRIYHVVLIPVSIVLFLFIGKYKKKRFKIYCAVVGLASIFEVAYSFLAGSHILEESNIIDNIMEIGIFRIIENTIYYQVQVLNSLFTGGVHQNGTISNILFLLIFISIIIVFIYLLLNKKYENKTLPCILGSLGIISLGTICVTVITSGSYENVRFPINYASNISWIKNYFQEMDLHFSYSYIASLFIFVVAVYYAKEYIINTKNLAYKQYLINFGSISLSVILLLLTSFHSNVREKRIALPTQWKSVYSVTYDEAYFMAINTFFGATKISLEHNSDELVYGIDNNKNGYIWDYGLPEYSMDLPYSEAILGDISDIEDKYILSITAKKALTNFDTRYVAILKDRNGNILSKIPQASTEDMIWIDFIVKEPIKNIYSISFELTDGNIAYVENSIQIGYKKMEKQ